MVSTAAQLLSRCTMVLSRQDLPPTGGADLVLRSTMPSTVCLAVGDGAKLLTLFGMLQYERKNAIYLSTEREQMETVFQLVYKSG